MRIFIRALTVFVVFVCLVFPVFSQSQSPHTEVFSDLGDSLEAAISRSTSILAGYDSQANNDGDYKVYRSYKQKYDALISALRESEARMDLLFRTNDRANYVKKERDHYNDLLTQLQRVKDDYDSWRQTVR